MEKIVFKKENFQKDKNDLLRLIELNVLVKKIFSMKNIKMQILILNGY